MAKNRIPKSRLNQIAQRKLESLGVSTRMSEDSERLEGALYIGLERPLNNPLTEEPIQRIAFVVEGHDHMRFLSPPALSGLKPQQFYDFDHLDKVVDRIRINLHRKASTAKQLMAKLEALSIKAVLDNNKIRTKAKLELAGTGTVLMEGDEQGLTLKEMRPLGGLAQPVSLGNLRVDINEFSDKTDMELLLSSLVQQASSAPQQDEQESPPPATQPPLSISAHKADHPPAELTLGRLSELMGPESLVSPGVVILRNLLVGGQPVRFAARADDKENFSGKLVSGDGVLWTGQFNLAQFPGVEDFVAGELGTAEVQTGPDDSQVGPAEPMESSFSEALASGQQLPIPGEIWVMATMVESDDGHEIRYVGIDIDGQPFGAPRVLPRETFEKIFSQVSHGVYRLPVEIVSVEDGQVNYLQLDPERNRVGDARSSRLAPFLSNFIPEAASY